MNPSSGPGAFGPFRVLHQVGVGVLGPVFRAYKPSDDRPFVVKVLRIDVTPEQARLLVDALQRAVAAGGLHPAVVVPVAAGIEEGTPFLVQEYIAAASLDVAARGVAGGAAQQTLELLDGLAVALDIAHDAGLRHGALHLRDVFVADGRPRMTGFGVVPALEEAGLRGPLRRPYSAPEIVAGGPWGPEADRFAFAALAYELLAGRRPVGAGAQNGARFLAPAGAADPEALEASFAAALAEAPEDRPASAGRFLTELREAFDAPAAQPVARPAVEPAPPRAPAAAVAATAGSAGADDIEDHGAPRADDGTQVVTAVSVPSRDVQEESDAGAVDDLERAAPELDAGAQTDAGVEDVAPPPPAMAGRRTAWPWWWPVAMATAAGLLIVAAAAAYVAGLRLGGNSAAPEAVAEVAPAPAYVEALPEVNLAPPPAARVPVEETPAVPVMPEAPEATAAPAPPQTTAAPTPPAAPEPRGGAVPGPPATREPRRAAPAGAEAGGWVLVRTMPPGATVTMGGAERGVTPLTVGDLPFGSLEVEVRHAGFQPATRQVALSAASPVVAIDVTLASLAPAAAMPPAEALGALVVESRPAGARVIVGGRSAGTTPTLVSGLAAGPHEVRIEREGYVTWTTSIDVEPASEVRVAASLEPEGAR